MRVDAKRRHFCRGSKIFHFVSKAPHPFSLSFQVSVTPDHRLKEIEWVLSLSSQTPAPSPSSSPSLSLSPILAMVCGGPVERGREEMRERMDVEHWRRNERSCYLYKNDAFLHRPAFLLIVLSLPVYVRVRRTCGEGEGGNERIPQRSHTHTHMTALLYMHTLEQFGSR